MSVEYSARMEVLQRRREDLTAQRQAVEKRLALREATAAEFSAVALQSYKQKWKTQRSAAIAAKKRNDEFIRSLHVTQRQVHDTWRNLQSDQSSNSALLAQEKAQYNRRVEQIYPAWQEQLQRQRVQKLRELEDKKRTVERRRYLAKKSFEKEQTLDDMIRKTRHEVEMAENLEQNELYERELLRTQSTHQAKEVDQSIREVALEARNHLQQQAAKHFEMTPEMDDGLADKLSETFSPRNALRALREGSSSFEFEENQEFEDEKKPARQIRVEIPTRMNTSSRSYDPDVNLRYSNQTYRAEETIQDDWLNQSPRGFADRSEIFNPALTNRHETGTIRNARDDYTSFEQSAATVQAPIVQRGQPRNLNTISGATFIQLPAQAEMKESRNDSHQISIGNERREELTWGPNDSHLEVLPTFVTGSLEPILEVNEQVLLHGSTRSNLNTVNVCCIGTEDGRKIDDAGRNSSFSFTPASTSSSSPPGLSSTLSVKIEENPTPGVRTVFTEPVNNLPTSDRVDKEDHLRVGISPTLVAKDATINEPPAINVPQSDNVFVLKPDLDEGKIEPPTLLLEEKMNILRQPDEAVDNASTVSEFNGPGGSLEMIGIGTEAVDIKPAGELEVNSMISGITDTADAQVLEQRSSHENLSKVDWFDDASSTLGSAGAIPTIIDSEASEAFIRESERSKSEKNSDGVLEISPTANPHTINLLEPLSPPALKLTHAEVDEDGMLLTSMQSDDFDLAASNVESAAEKLNIPNIDDTTVIGEISGVLDSAENLASSLEVPSPPVEEEETIPVSITEKLSPVDRVKALGALISRVEEGATEGDTLSGSVDTGSSNESKRELLKMAVGGRKAQIAFFGSDICFELILDISRDLGPVLFPPKAFEGIMNDQKLRKVHQSNKEKQLDLWKTLSGYMKQLVQLKAIPSSTLVELYVTAFLAHDPDNQRSQRKLREFLVILCGGSKPPSPRKGAPTSSSPPSPPKQTLHTTSPEPAPSAVPESRIGTPTLLQTAFLQRQSPPKPRTFGIASSSYNDRSSGSSDVLASMSSGPMKLSQKLMRGGKMNDYSEFEEEEEVDLQNLIGSKPTFTSGSFALGRSTYQAAKTSRTDNSTAKQAAVEEEDDEFDF